MGAMVPKSLLVRITGQGLLPGLLLLTLLAVQTLGSGHFYGEDNNPSQCLLCKTDNPGSIAAESTPGVGNPRQSLFPLTAVSRQPAGPASQYKARAPPRSLS